MIIDKSHVTRHATRQSLNLTLCRCQQLLTDLAAAREDAMQVLHVPEPRLAAAAAAAADVAAAHASRIAAAAVADDSLSHAFDCNVNCVV